MTTMNTENDHDSSAADQSTSPPAHSKNGYGEHQNGNDYNGETNDSQSRSSFQTGYSQGSENGTSTSTGSKPDDDRKLFVGGLTWDTTTEDLREYFLKFGNIVDCSIKHDPSTGRSRGFAFLVFDSKDIVEKILSQNEHFVKGRKVDPKPAHRRLNPTNNLNNNSLSSQSSFYGVTPSSTATYSNSGASSYNNNRKVFIGGLDPNFPDAQLREYFSKFGKIDEIDLPYDKEKNERRPFCFISFQTEQAAQEVLRLQRHTIGDMSVDVKRAKPKTSNNQQQQYQQQVYDPYGRQNMYANYANPISGYNNNVYPPADGYAHWNAYTYNQQANPAAYSFGGSSSPGTSTYSQYSDQAANSQYSYQGSNANDFYSQYGYNASQPAGVYNEPKAYASGYDYGNYYSSANSGMNNSMDEHVNGQQAGNSPGNATDYDHENHYGKTKTCIVSSPTYHPYSRT